MRILESPANRWIAGVMAVSGLVYSGLTIEAWGAPELWKFCLRVSLFLASIWLLGRVLLQSRLAKVQLPRSLEIWSRLYVVLICVVSIGGGVALTVTMVARSSLTDIVALLMLGLLSVSVWGVVGYVAIVLPLWAVCEAIRAGWRRAGKVVQTKHGDV
jgi:hypothetical protein